MRYLHQSLFINHRVWSNKTSLMPPLFIEVPVPGHLSETVMHLCIMGIDVASFSRFFYWNLELFRQCGIFGVSFCMYDIFVVQGKSISNQASTLLGIITTCFQRSY